VGKEKNKVKDTIKGASRSFNGDKRTKKGLDSDEEESEDDDDDSMRKTAYSAFPPLLSTFFRLPRSFNCEALQITFVGEAIQTRLGCN